MDQEMLRAAQEAAWAAQSAGEAAWWGLLVNGLVVAVAVGATAFQDWRVSARLKATDRAYNGRAKVTLNRAIDALDAAAPIFHAADDTAGSENLDELLEEIERTIPLVVHYQSSNIGVDYLAALIKAEASLRSGASILQEARSERERGRYANGRHNGQIDWRADDLKKDVAKLR